MSLWVLSWQHRPHVQAIQRAPLLQIQPIHTCVCNESVLIIAVCWKRGDDKNEYAARQMLPKCRIYIPFLSQIVKIKHEDEEERSENDEQDEKKRLWHW